MKKRSQGTGKPASRGRDAVVLTNKVDPKLVARALKAGAAVCILVIPRGWVGK